MMLASRAPAPALTDHPAFILMIGEALSRFHCTLGELREDYWLGRAWRALAGDPLLAGRVARQGIEGVLMAGPFADGVVGAEERVRLRLHAEARILADTGHSAASLGLKVRFADDGVDAGEACVVSLLAQVVRGDPRWDNLAAYQADLSPVVLPVAFAIRGIAAA